jgi:putative hydrolase of HD superfamily
VINIAFYEEIGKLKGLPRTGWVKRGIPNPETVAGHMYRSQFIAYDLAKKMGADPIACAHMMMIHDLPEAKAGDITPTCGVTRDEKAALEIQAARELAEMSGNLEFLDIFTEYEEKLTLKAQICNDADQLECLVQALEYASIYPDKRPLLESFWPYAEAKLLTDPGKEMYAQLLKQKHVLTFHLALNARPSLK